MTGAPTTRTLRAIAAAALAAIAVAALVIALGGGDERRSVFVDVAEATNVISGQDVRAGGVRVGEVAGIEPTRGGRGARLELSLEDRVWPLTKNSRLLLRWGGTANFSNRYIDLDLGARGAAPVAEDGTLPSANFRAPVEFDTLLRAFPQRVREQGKRFLDNAGPALEASAPPLRKTLESSPAVLHEASFVLQDLHADERSLHGLVTAADSVLGAVDRAQPGVRELLSGAAGTFTAAAGESRALQESLELAPSTFARARTTLARADRTLDSADVVVRRVGPGVKQVRAIARPLSELLGQVTAVGPDARRTLASLKAASPDLDKLTSRATGQSPQLESIGRQSVENLRCIRPYSPDIMSFFSNWGDFFSAPDGKDKLIRAQVQNYLPAPGNVMVNDAGEAAKLFPGLTYGFPRPPGTNAGQPWFLPECGAGPDALDPSKDPEARPFSDVMKIPTAERGR